MPVGGWAISPASVLDVTSETRRAAQRLADSGNDTIAAVVRGGGSSAIVQAALDDFAARATPLAQWSSARAQAVADGTESALRAYDQAQVEMADGSDRSQVGSDRFAPRIAW